MPDQQVREINPVLLRHDFHKRTFDLLRRADARETHASGKSRDVGVHNYTIGNTEGRAENDIGGLAPDAFELQEFGHRARHLPAMSFGDRPATIANRAGFVAKKTCGMNERLKFTGRAGRKVGGGPIAGENGRSDLINAYVCALGA